MKNRLFPLVFLLSCMALFSSAACLSGVSENSGQERSARAFPKVAVVDAQRCLEHTKLGKKERAQFDAMKAKVESTLMEKEKTLSEMSKKFSDPDYLDSLSPEAEGELKHKFRTLSQDYSQCQNFYMQALNQTQMQVLQRLSDAIDRAATAVAKEQAIDFVFKADLCSFFSPSYDVTDRVVVAMDAAFDQEESNDGLQEEHP